MSKWHPDNLPDDAYTGGVSMETYEALYEAAEQMAKAIEAWSEAIPPGANHFTEAEVGLWEALAAYREGE